MSFVIVVNEALSCKMPIHISVLLRRNAGRSSEMVGDHDGLDLSSTSLHMGIVCSIERSPCSLTWINIYPLRQTCSMSSSRMLSLETNSW